MNRTPPEHSFKSGLGFKITRAAAILQFAVDEALAPFDMTRMCWIILASVRFDGKVTVTEVARHIGAERTAVSRTVSRMEQDGILQRTKSVKDGRATALGVTSKGEQLCAELPGVVRAALSPHLKDLSPNQLAKLGALLDSIDGGEVPFISWK